MAFWSFLHYKTPDCLWYRQVGGTKFCYQRGDPSHILSQFEEFEEDITQLWQINEASDKEYCTIKAELISAKNDFLLFLKDSKATVHNY